MAPGTIGRGVSITFYGHAAFKLSGQGVTVVIDPWLSNPLLNTSVSEVGPVDVICVTHGHADHVAGVCDVRREFPDVKVCIHKSDASMLVDSGRNLSSFAGQKIVCGEADVVFEDEGAICYAGVEFEIIHTPGHTEGGICLYNKAEGVLFSGDSLFAGSIGRTDFPGYDTQKRFEELVSNIKSKLAVLPAETRVFSGHGPATTIRNEKKHNPYLR